MCACYWAQALRPSGPAGSHNTAFTRSRTPSPCPSWPPQAARTQQSCHGTWPGCTLLRASRHPDRPCWWPVRPRAAAPSRPMQPTRAPLDLHAAGCHAEAGLAALRDCRLSCCCCCTLPHASATAAAAARRRMQPHQRGSEQERPWLAIAPSAPSCAAAAGPRLWRSAFSSVRVGNDDAV